MRSLLPFAFGLSIVLAMPCFAAADHLVLGLDDDEGMLLNPRQIEEGPDGDLYVLDAGEDCIKVYSPEGEFRRRLAGLGEGPGLFQRVDGASFGFTPDGRLYFTEFIRGHRWITIMDLDGEGVEVVSPELDTGFGVQAAVPLSDGGFLVQLIFSSTTRAHQDYYLYDSPEALVRMDAEGSIRSELKRTAYTRLISFSPNGGTTNLPDTPSFAWCVLDAERVVWSDGLSPELAVIDHAGHVVGTIATSLPEPEAVTRDEIREWQQQRKEMMLSNNPGWWQEFGRVVESYDEALYDKPVFGRLSRTPGGNILVEGAWSADGAGLRLWLLGVDGELLTEVVANAWRLTLSDRFGLYLANDDDGATRAHAVEWSGDEVGALERIAGASLAD